jgi:hypothetical protein
MDPFTVSTGLAGFLSLALELAKSLSNYASGVKSAPADANLLYMEITALCNVLEDLIKFLRAEASRGDQSAFQQESYLYSAIGLCQADIQKLYHKFEKFHGVDKIARLLEQLKWPLRKDDCDRTVNMLQRFSQTFQFSLLVSNRCDFQIPAQSPYGLHTLMLRLPAHFSQKHQPKSSQA